MNPSSEFNIESKPCSFSFLLKSLGDELDKTHKLQDFISRLEEERLKIDAFKRELPLCMQLLNDAVEASRQQLAACSQASHNPRPVLEEFIPLKHQEASERNLNSTVEATAAGTGSWMATTQIWSQSNDGTKNQGPAVSVDAEHGLIGSSKLALDAKQRVGGAFLPFSKERNGATQQALRSQLPDLALAPSDKNGTDEPKLPEAVELAVPISRFKASDQSSVSQSNCNGGGGVVGGATERSGGNEVQAAGGGQSHRKPRRCWSPDLHRRFVSALQQLGGSQAATPKQIRELMKVDGLTNDEVKSHLQKYRLHTRRPSPTPQAVTAPAPQLVVLGGIWVPPEYTTAAHTAAPGIYSATIAAAAAAQSAPPAPPPPPTHYCHASPLPQDFCTQLSTPPHHQLRHVYCDQQLTAANHNSSKNNNNAGDKDKNNNSNSSRSSEDHNNKTSSNSRSSPRSSTAGGRSQSVEEEDRSESGSWRGESTENEVGREMGRALSLKRRATLRSEEEEEDREESTGSDITLKF